MVQRLARLSGISFDDVSPPQSAQIVVRGEIAALPLAGVIDIEGEKQRLAKELAKLDQDILTVDHMRAMKDMATARLAERSQKRSKAG